MKSLVLGLAVFASLLLSLSAATQSNKLRDDQAVRAAVTDYIDGYYTGDAARMERSLHPHYLKHTISDSDGGLRMTEKTGLQMVEDVRSNGRVASVSEPREQITVLDVSGDIASAKLVTPGWTDYITLSRWNGEWKIVSVVLREKN